MQENETGASMNRELLDRLVAATGVGDPAGVAAMAHIEDADPLLKTPLKAAETAAAALAAQAALVCEIWRMRTGRRQTVALDLQGAALALQSVFYQRQWANPIMLTEPRYPTVDLYPTKDGRWIMINGGYPALRDGLLDLLQCADSKEAVAGAVSRWRATEPRS